MVRLYKFRPLASGEDLRRAKIIVETGCFWCSRFSELNDPMEGVFTASDTVAVHRIYNEKNKYRICSFCNDKGFQNPLMWGYYANGFKGVAIEVEVDEADVNGVKYVSDIPDIRNLGDDVENVLMTKLSLWAHEGEHRFLKDIGKANFYKIGIVTAVYFGDPYGDVSNKDAVYRDNEHLRKYKELKERISTVMGQHIKQYTVSLEGCDVKPKEIKINA
ncbi:MAG: hypothetical protein HQL22_09650 [Candidatus Omnitrophica bacterium]|nr:hypothetical protein [Candidatus Omnitrophota bacterium]